MKQIWVGRDKRDIGQSGGADRVIATPRAQSGNIVGSLKGRGKF